MAVTSALGEQLWEPQASCDLSLLYCCEIFFEFCFYSQTFFLPSTTQRSVFNVASATFHLHFEVVWDIFHHPPARFPGLALFVESVTMIRFVMHSYARCPSAAALF